MMFNPIFIALITFFVWGVGDIFGTVASRKIGAAKTTLWVSVCGIIFFAPVALLHISDLRNLSISLFILMIVFGAFDVFGNFAFNRATQLSTASLTGTLAASFATVTTILSVIFLHDSLNIMQTISIIFIFFGIILATLKFSEIKNSHIFHDPGIKWALASMISWGIFFTFIKLIVQRVGWFWPIYIPFFFFPIFYRWRDNSNLPNQKKLWLIILPLCGSALLLRSGDMLFNIGITHSQTAIFAPIAGSYPILYSLLAYYVFKEQLSKQQVCGITCTLIGITALAYFS